MIITHNREKLVNSTVYFVKNTKYCGVTKLMKLLYHLDFMHFRQTGRSVTGQAYYAWERGPVPREFYKEVESRNTGMKADLKAAISLLPQECGFQKLVAKKDFDPKHFSKRELTLLKSIAYIFHETQADLMVEATHFKNSPWQKTIGTKGKNALIDYMLAVDGSKDSLSFEAIKERLAERQEIKEAFDEEGNYPIP